MTKKGYELTEAEWALIQAVWDNEPCAAPTVQEALQNRRNWTYSTVKTMMDRMVAKGLLKTERIRNLILYQTTGTKGRGNAHPQTRLSRRPDAHDAVYAREHQPLTQTAKRSGSHDQKQTHRRLAAKEKVVFPKQNT